MNEDIEQLHALMMTEVHAPDILPYQADLIDGILDALRNQQAVIDDKVDTPEEVFTASLYQMDIDRIRYAVARYLRARLLKIEALIDYILSRHEYMDRLSPNEKIYIAKLHNLNTSFQEETLYNRVSAELKDVLQSSDDFTRHTQPSLQEFVFCRIVTDIAAVDLGDGNPTDLRKGELIVAKYIHIKNYVVDGQIHLV